MTFNQFGREMPMGGMNEAGLVIENMWLEDTRYPAPDDRPEIGLLQWIQYQLDTCRTVADVIATDHHVRLKQPNNPVKVHYFTCDATGDCATIEFLDGKMVQHRGRNLPFKALANSTYSQSVTFTQANPESGNGTGRLQNPTSLLRRFFYSSRELASSHPRHCASVPLDLRPLPDRLSLRFCHES